MTRSNDHAVSGRFITRTLRKRKPPLVVERDERSALKHFPILSLSSILHSRWASVPQRRSHQFPHFPTVANSQIMKISTK